MEKKQELQIIIAGRTTVGKSTVMFEIYKMLELYGFDVELDVGEDYYNKPKVFVKAMEMHRLNRLNAVFNKTKIIISEKNTITEPNQDNINN